MCGKVFYMKNKGKTLLLSIVLGLLFAAVFRLESFTMTTDFSYVRIFGIENVDLQSGEEGEEVGWSYVGKNILNPPYSGFPFPVYQGCNIRALGLVTFAPRCEENFLGEWATLLNFIFWTGGIYFIVKFIGKKI